MMYRLVFSMLLAAGMLAAGDARREIGRQAFESTCSRCHGTDGKLAEYQYIKTLHGLGKRLTKAEIRERLRAVRLSSGQYLCRGTVFSREQLDALVKYVARL